MAYDGEAIALQAEPMRYAVRSLARVPGLTAASILMIALGVGAGTALFSVVKAVLLNPLPYADPHRLAWLAEINSGGKDSQVSFPNFDDWRSQNRTFEYMAAYGDGPSNASGGEVPQRTYGAEVTEDFFNVLGVPPSFGRTFSSSEHKPHARLTVVLSHGLWQ